MTTVTLRDVGVGHARPLRPIRTAAPMGGRRLLRVQPVQHPRERDGLANVLQPADPGYAALDSHAEPAVRHGPVLTQIDVPIERLLGQMMLLDALEQQFDVVYALPAADDLAVAL